jgi:hypothetical protein
MRVMAPESRCAVALFGVLGSTDLSFLSRLSCQVGLGQGVLPHLMSMVFGSIVQQDSE